MIQLRSCLLVLSISLGASFSAATASQLDQEWVVNPVFRSVNVQADYSHDQTFTVGIPGMLDRVDLQVGRQQFPALLDVIIRRTLPDGSPDSAAAAIAALVTVNPVIFPAEVFPTGFVQIDLGAQAIPVSLGERLTIELYANSASNAPYGWATTDSTDTPPTPGYLGGSAYYRHPPGSPVFISEPTHDHGFRTFVTPVPEPAAVTLAIAGSLGFSLLQRPDRSTMRPCRMGLPSFY